MNYRYIAVEGNIGAGKSTLASKLASHFTANLIEEEFESNALLPSFYKDPDKYAYPLELSFLLDRFRQLKSSYKQGDRMVSDFWFNKSWVFGKTNLPKEQWDQFSKVFDSLAAEVPKPDLVIYYHRDIEGIQESIKMRGRSYESGVSEKYLSKLERNFKSYCKNIRDVPLLWVEGNAFAPGRNKEHFKAFLEAFQAPLNPGLNLFEKKP